MAAKKHSKEKQEGMKEILPIERKSLERKKNTPKKSQYQSQPQGQLPPSAESTFSSGKSKSAGKKRKDSTQEKAAFRLFKQHVRNTPIETGTPPLIAKLFECFRQAIETSSDDEFESSTSSSSDAVEEEDARPKSRFRVNNGSKTKEKTATKISTAAGVTSAIGDSNDSGNQSGPDGSAQQESMAKLATKRQTAQAIKIGDSSEDSASQPSNTSSTTLHGTPPVIHLQHDQTVHSDDISSSESSSSDDDISSSEISSSDDESVPASPPPKVAKESKRKRSASPKGTTDRSSKAARKDSKPFSRIPNDVQVDPRLASNAYVPYDYAERAHQDLVVTKGKEFTKEKNKKKRGSYRGGAIDISGGKAIKFDETGN